MRMPAAHFVPTLTERLQRDHWITAAHVADWRAVDKKSGDLLYVGRTINLRNRLNPHNHIMWSIYVHEAKPPKRVRIAIWENLDVENEISQTCHPLWSRNRHAAEVWTWHEPDLIVAPSQVQNILANTVGTYAWLHVPPGASLQKIMLDCAADRRPRCVKAPDIYYCHGNLTVHVPCMYRWIERPDDLTKCPRCGAGVKDSEERADQLLLEAFNYS